MATTKTPTRKPRVLKATKPVAVSFLPNRKERTEDTQGAAVTFDRRLQHRSKLTDPETVEEYAELLKQPAFRFHTNPKAVREKDGDGRGNTVLWVYNGFQRGAAYDKVGRESYPVDIIDGTFADAMFLSLSANSDNGLSRTGDDKRRAVFAMLDSPDALALVLGKAKAFGGFHRVAAAACGCSTGWIDAALEERGLSAKGDTLVKRKPKKEKPGTPAGDPPPPPLVDAPAKALTPEEKAAKDAEQYRELLALAHLDRVTEARKLVKRLGVLVSSLAIDREHGESVRALLKSSGIPIADEFTIRASKEGVNFSPYYEIMELWPVASRLGEVFSTLMRAPSSPANPDPAPAVENETPPAEPVPSANGKRHRGKAKIPTK